jgi:N-glycosylase/DNA lyase
MTKKNILNNNSIEIQKTFLKIQNDINHKLSEFRNIKDNGTDLDIYFELAFCLLTPQSKAKRCWEAINTLNRKDLLFHGTEKQLSEELNYVRFKNTKAKNLIRIRTSFYNKNSNEITLVTKLKNFQEPHKMREWLVEKIHGMGYKEASHFLRNIGYGESLAILDRHILKNLIKCKVISEIPKSLTKNKYLEIEKKMKTFANEINISLDSLDLLLWYNETGEIFK